MNPSITTVTVRDADTTAPGSSPHVPLVGRLYRAEIDRQRDPEHLDRARELTDE